MGGVEKALWEMIQEERPTVMAIYRGEIPANELYTARTLQEFGNLVLTAQSLRWDRWRAELEARMANG